MKLQSRQRNVPFRSSTRVLRESSFFYGDATSAILSDLPRSGFVVITFDDGNRESVPVRDTGGSSPEVGSPVPD